MYDHILGNVHHAVVIGVCLVQLDGGELRVVLGVHALVAENTADLIYLLKAAHDQALEVQLGRNAHVHIDVERIVVRDERARRRAARDGVETRGLDLHKAAAIHKLTDLAHDCRALFKGVAHLGVDDQVNIALAVAHIGVLEAMPLFGQRREVFGEQRQLMHRNRDLTLLGAEHLALHADNITDVEFLVALVDLVAHVVALDIQLQPAVAVGQVGKGGFAHNALAHHAAGKAYGFAFQLFEMLVDLIGVVVAFKAHLLVRVRARGLQLRQLLAADALQLMQFLCGLLVLFLRLMLFCHVFPIFLIVYDFTRRSAQQRAGGRCPPAGFISGYP